MRPVDPCPTALQCAASPARSNHPYLNKDVRRRTGAVDIFPRRAAMVRLTGAVLAEQNDEWAESQRHMGPDILAACRKTVKSRRER